MRKFFTQLLLMVLLLPGMNALAQRTVTGKVTDAAGNPVAGASVQVQNTTVGTITREDGTFSLNVPSNGRVLVISAVGMTSQEITLGSQSNFNVSLRTGAEAAMQEVVVVGYGTQRRRDVTGNVSTVSGTKLKDVPLQSFEQGLSGRAAGVNINIPNGVLNNPPVIRIRGVNSISLSSFPLVVIDGVPMFTGDAGGTASNNVLGDINPSDIESIDVLKDAAAAAIYGSRAAAGVLILTTKKGRQGRTRVNYDGWVGWTKAYNLIEVLNAQEYTDLKNEGLVNAGTPPNGTNRGFYTTTDAGGNLVDTRWYDYIYRTGMAHNHSVSISGANDRTNYYFSTGFTEQEGMLKKNNFKRISGRFNLDHNVNKWLAFGGNVQYTVSNTNGLNSGSNPGSAFATSGAGRLPLVLAPNVSPYNNDGSYNINVSANQIGQGKNLTALSFTNPVPLLDLNKFLSSNNRLLGNVNATITFLPGLQYITKFAMDNLNTENFEFRNPLHGDGVQFNGAAQKTLQRYKRNSWQNLLQYDTRIAQDHSLGLLTGYEWTHTNNEGWGADRRNATDDFFNDYQGNYLDIVPTGNFLTESEVQSYFGRMTYDYKKKYYFSANARRDGFSALAVKWGTFWGLSAGWFISGEDFYKSSNLANTLSTFKIRGSYGKVGNNQGLGEYPSLTLFNGGLYGPYPSIFYSQAGNEKLMWETSKKTDVGVTLGFFRDRFTIDAAYYKNDIDDLILAEPQAPSRGIPGNQVFMNVGRMVNKGLELTLNGTILSKKDFTWTSNFNITTLKNEVMALANNNADIQVATSGLERPSIIRVGESIGSFYAVQTKGVNPANGNRIFVLVTKRDPVTKQVQETLDVQYDAVARKWTTLDGTASRGADQSVDGQIFGPALPKYFGGFDNTFRYKGFDLNLLLYFSGGNYVYNGTKAGLHDNRNWNNAKDALQRWTKAGDNALWPKVVFGDNLSNGSGIVMSNNIEKGDFIKGRNVTLGYSFPKSIVDRINLSNVRFYVSMLNAFTITDYSGFDPEIQSNGNSNGGPSVDRNSVPQARSINVGLNIGF